MLLKGDVAIRVERKQVWGFLIGSNQGGKYFPGAERIEVTELNKQ
jgi:carbon monoxide dehydrogenase subunit G